MRNFSASLLVSIYTLAPLISTRVLAKEYAPYGSCDPTKEDCKLQGPGWDLFNPIDSLLCNIVYWITGIVEVLADVGINIFARSSGDWVFKPVGVFVDFFNQLSLLMLAIGVFLAIAETAVSYSNGQGNVAGSIINIVKAFVFALLYTNVMIYLFETVLDLGGLIMANGVGIQITDGTLGNTLINVGGDLIVADASIGAISKVVQIILVKWFEQTEGIKVVLSIAQTAGNVGKIGIFILIFVLFFVVIVIIKFGLLLDKRIVVFMALLSEGSLLPFSMARGYAGNFQSFLQKSMTFMLSCILQVWFFALGIYFIAMAPGSEHWWAIMLVGYAFVECADKVSSYLGTVGGDSGGGLMSGAFRSAMGAVHTIQSTCAHNDLHNMAHGGDSGSKTNNTSTNQAGTTE